MKNYKILAFKQDHLVFELDEVSGLFKSDDKTRGLMDLISLNIKITKLKDEIKNRIIKVGDKRTKIISIQSIYFDQNKPKLFMSDNAILNVEDFKLYTEKIEMTKEKSVKQDDFKDIEAKILAMYQDKPIRLEATLKKTAKDLGLEKFLIKFFKEWNNKKDTIYVGTKGVQTPKAKRRSLGDIFMICKYYFPECTLKQVIDLLCNKLSIQIPGFRTSWCKMIKKRTWYVDTQKGNGVYDHNQLDEYNNLYKYYIENTK